VERDVRERQARYLYVQSQPRVVLCAWIPGFNGRSYTWCRTGVHLDSRWDYCTPSDGQVIQVTYTIHGQQCSGECGQQGQDYWWCYKSTKHNNWIQQGYPPKNIQQPNSRWDYCSKDNNHTRYNKKCRDECSTDGESYYWCQTMDDSWDYCSPGVQDVDPEPTRRGGRCDGVCDQRSNTYSWCYAYWAVSGPYWDYCGPSLNQSSIVTVPVPVFLMLLFYLQFTDGNTLL